MRGEPGVDFGKGEVVFDAVNPVFFASDGVAFKVVEMFAWALPRE